MRRLDAAVNRADFSDHYLRRDHPVVRMPAVEVIRDARPRVSLLALSQHVALMPAADVVSLTS